MSEVLTADIDLLLFEVGDQLYATDAAQVVRIDASGADAVELPSLGVLKHGRRALVFWWGQDEQQLRVDGVRGVKHVSVQALRRMPKAAAADPYAVGVWLDGETPVLLIDLVESYKFQERQ